MKRIIVLAAFALGTVMAHQVAACDMGRIEADAGLLACQGNNCATEPTTTQQPAYCAGQGCAKPEATAPATAGFSPRLRSQHDFPAP